MDPNRNVSDVGRAVAAVPPSRGWWRRIGLRLVLGVVIIVVLVGGSVCGWIVFGALSKKWSDPYQVALKQVQGNPQVIERLGQPIADVTWPPPTGELDSKDEQGEANLTFGVQGPKARAEVLVQARRVAGQWGLISLHVVFKDNSRLSLDVKEAGDKKGGLEDAPAWKP